MKDSLTTFARQLPNKVGDTNEAGTGADDNLTNDLANIVNIIIGLLGVVAVITIILGGVQYMTANGEPTKIKKAKDIILYGVIGLVVVILSAAVVNFVILKVGGSGTTEEDDTGSDPTSYVMSLEA